MTFLLFVLLKNACKMMLAFECFSYHVHEFACFWLLAESNCMIRNERKLVKALVNISNDFDV